MNKLFSSQKQQRTLRAGFTLVELLVIVAVIGIVSGIGLTTMASFLQEQRLRQAAFELASYLQSARARAQRDGKICRVEIDGTIIKPSNYPDNSCYSNTPRLPELNLAAASGASGLTITPSPTPLITFTPDGTLASPASNAKLFYSPTIFLGYSSTFSSRVQRCVYLDLVSILVGWRNSKDVSKCTFDRG